jgi:hypothetical protein
MPDSWRSRGPWIAAGLLGVLAAVLHLGRHRSTSPPLSSTERGLYTTEPRTQSAAEPQPRTQDSFSMIEKDPAPAAKKSKTPEEFFAAMDAIAKKGEPARKSSVYPSRIQAMADFFASSGGGSPAPSLPAPSSKDLVQTPHAAGPGASPMVPRDRDFRAAYADSSRCSGKNCGPSSPENSRSSALSGKPSGSTPLPGGSPMNPASAPGGRSPSGDIPETGGEGKKGRIPVPPKVPDGKPVDSAKKSDAAAAAVDSAKKAGASASPALGASAAGQSGIGRADPDEEEIQTGVSSQGLAKDARSGDNLGKGLVEAGDKHLSSTPPQYNADALLASKQDDRTKVAATKPYNSDGIARAATAGQNAPNPPARVPEAADDLVKNTKFVIGDTGDAQRLVINARQDFNKAVAEASSYQLALQKGGKTIEENNKEATALSSDLGRSQKDLQAGVRSLQSLKPKLASLGAEYHAAADLQTRKTISDSADGLIRQYKDQAASLAEESGRIAKQAQPLEQKTSRARDENRTSLVTASDTLQRSLAALDASVRNLAAQVASAGKGEGDATQLSIMRNNGMAIVQQLTAGQRQLQTLKLGYDKLARRELRAGKAVDQAVRGLSAEP